MDVLPLTVCRWKRNLDLSALKNAQADPYLRALSWINKDGRLACRKLASSDSFDGKHVLLPKTTPVQQYMWLPSKNESLLRLVVLDEDSDVFVYSVTVKEEGLFESTRVATISSKTISESLKAKRQSDSPLKWRLTGSVVTQLNTVLLSVNAESIAVLTVDGEALELKFVLECSAKGSSSDQGAIIDAALMNNLLFVLLDKGIVLVFTLKTGTQVACVDLQSAARHEASEEEGTEKSFTRLTVLPSLGCLVCTTSDHKLYFVNLSQYFEEHKSCIQGKVMDELMSGRKKTKVRQPVFSNDDEEDLYILGYRSGTPSSVAESVQEFWKYRLTQFEERQQLQQQQHQQKDRSTHTLFQYTWENIVSFHCPEVTVQPSPVPPPGGDGKSPSESASSRKSVNSMTSLSILKWISSPEKNRSPVILMVRAQGNSLLVYCTQQSSQEHRTKTKITVLVFDCTFGTNLEPSITRLLKSPVLVPCLASQHYGGLVVRENSAILLTCGISDQEFINKVLMYDNAEAAEAVCRLNRWEKRTLPLNALKMALELKQMDTIAFFLRPITTQDEGDQDDEGSTSSPQPSVPLLPGQLEGAMDLIVARLQKCFAKSQYIVFAKQLLKLSLEFLVNIISVSARSEGVTPGSEETQWAVADALPRQRRRNLTSETSEGSVHEHGYDSVSMDVVAEYMKKLWSFISKDEPLHDVSKQKADGGWDKCAIFPGKWSSMTIREIVKDSLLQGCLPLAQSFVLRHSSTLEYQIRDATTDDVATPTVTTPKTPLLSLQSLEDAIDQETTSGSMVDQDVIVSVVPPTSFTYQAFLSTGIGLVVEALHKEDVELARHLILNMGFSVKDTLCCICFHTLDRKLRDFLICELDGRNWLSDEERKAIEYLHHLEQVYPIHCYHRAVGTRRGDRDNRGFFFSISFPGDTAVPLDSRFPTYGNADVLYPEDFGGNYSVYSSPTGDQSVPGSLSLYAQVPLQAVLQWSQVVREKVLLEAHLRLRSQDSSDESVQTSFKNETRQAFYVEHSDLTSWRREVLPSFPAAEEGRSCSPADVQNVMCVTEFASEYAREEILLQLGRRNIFIDSELTDFTKLLMRLATTHGLFSREHPLLSSVTTQLSPRMRERELSPLSRDGDAVLSFHRNFIKYCITNGYSNLLYYYLDHHRLALYQESLHELGLLEPQSPWVDVMVQCRLAAEGLNDPLVMFSSSLACSRLLLGGDNKPLEHMIRQGRTLMALATMMYSGISLTNATAPASANEVWHVEEQLLREALVPHPKLMAAIFPPPPKKGTPAETQDISLYQLLQGNTPFNVQNLFGWQSTNTLSKGGRSSAFRELPHFSSSDLVATYSQEEHLSYLFFLRQGLPSFAYANFIVGKKVTKKNFQKKASGALPKVYSLAFIHIYEDRVTSACAAFIEMLGMDSSNLRVDLQSARRIIEFSDGGYTESSEGASLSDEGKLAREEKQRSTVSLFIKMNGSLDSTIIQDTVQESILEELETVTVAMTKDRTTGTSPCNQKTEDVWDLPQQFCKIHQLPPTQVYLRMCAEQGNWLSFLCHAQRYCFQPEELVPLVRAHFSDEAVAEHLVLSLTANLEDRRTDAGKSVHFREKYYQRMGVTKPQVEESAKESTPKSQSVTPEDVDPSQVPLDLFGVIFKCRASDSLRSSMLAHAVAVKEPLLAILAACENSSQPLSLDCVCVWLLTTMDRETYDMAEKLLGRDSKQRRSWSLHDLSLLIALYVVRCKLSLFNLVLLFEYFDPNNSLKFVMKFYHTFTELHDYEESVQILRLFEDSQRRNTKKKEDCAKMAIDDPLWVESITAMVMKHMVVLHSTPYERRKLLGIVSGVDSKTIQKCVDFSTLGHVAELVWEVGIGPDEAIIAMEMLTSHVTGSGGMAGSDDVPPGSGPAQPTDQGSSVDQIYQAEIRINTELIMRKLMEKGEFEVARKCAAFTDIRLTDVVLQEAHHMVKELRTVKLWSNKQERMNLWLKCSTKFERFRVEPSIAVKFFESQLKSIEGIPDSQEGGKEEEALLYMLVLKWLRQSPVITPTQLRLKEKEIWLIHIKSIVKEKEKKKCILITPSLLSVCSPKPSALLTTSASEEVEEGNIDLSRMVLVQDVPIRPPIPSALLNAEEQEALDLILGRLLNMGRIDEARKLADLFDQGSKELSIVLTCIKLCQGQLTPDTMSTELIQGLRVGGPSHRRLSGQVGPALTSLSERSTTHGVIQMVGNLMDHSQHAKDCCRRILICYKISVLLGWPYSVVMEKGPLDLVMSLFACRDAIKYTLAHEFISLCHLPCEVIGDFIGKRIKEALEHHFKVAEAPSESLDLYPDASMSGDVFTSTLAQLCPQHAVLGRCLLEHAKNKLDSIDSNVNNLLVAVELLIRSHDCFSMTCNTDGIAEVLREAYLFFEALHRHRKFSVMVRLLTGIGRFRDMVYIIDLLISTHHFELLLQKDLEKTDDLKIALYEYISHRCPDDAEMMMMFTLRYQMHREHATVIEGKATKELAEIKIKKSDANTRLKHIWQEYMVAAEFYAKENCLSSKEKCISLARLVALQLSLMPQQLVINLDRQEVAAFLEKSSSFQHGLVVANGYKYSMKIDWVDPLYRHAVVQGDMRYLSDFKKVYPLNSQVLEELVKRCKRNEGKNSQIISHMTRILENEPISVVSKRRLLLELKKEKGVPELDGFHHDISSL